MSHQIEIMISEKLIARLLQDSVSQHNIKLPFFSLKPPQIYADAFTKKNKKKKRKD